jgi:hypothetical protein
LHPEKSQLTPDQHGPGTTFLGMECDLRPEHMVLRLTRTKRHSYRRSVQRLLSSPSSLWSARSLAQTLGRLVSAREAVEGAMYRCRSLQRIQTEALRRGGWDRPCQMLSPECLSDLQLWATTLSTPTSCRMKLLRIHHEETIDTDSSPWGWGSPCEWRRVKMAHWLGFLKLSKLFEQKPQVQYDAGGFRDLNLVLQLYSCMCVTARQQLLWRLRSQSSAPAPRSPLPECCRMFVRGTAAAERG